MQLVDKEAAAFHPSPRGRFANHLHRVLRTESRKPYWDNIETRPEAKRPLNESYGKATDLIITNFHTGPGFGASSPREPNALSRVRLHEPFRACKLCAGYRCGRQWGIKPPRSVIGHTNLIPDGFGRRMFFLIAGWWHMKARMGFVHAAVLHAEGLMCSDALQVSVHPYAEARESVSPLQASLVAMKINKNPGFYAVSTPEQPNPKVWLLLACWELLLPPQLLSTSIRAPAGPGVCSGARSAQPGHARFPVAHSLLLWRCGRIAHDRTTSTQSLMLPSSL